MPGKGLEKGVEFEEGEKDLRSKGLFPLLKSISLLLTTVAAAELLRQFFVEIFLWRGFICFQPEFWKFAGRWL